LAQGLPKIFNTDQGVQFTGQAFTGPLARRGIAISMDSRGRALDNVSSERLWRSVKYEEMYLRETPPLEDRKIISRLAAANSKSFEIPSAA